MQDHGPHHLHVERTHTRGATGRLPRHREGLGHEVVERLTVFQACLELQGLRPQRLVGESDDLAVPRADRGHSGLKLLEFLALAEAKDLVNDLDHGPSLSLEGASVPAILSAKARLLSSEPR